MINENVFESANTNLQVLINNALNEKNTDKKKVLHAIYTYALDKNRTSYLKTKNLWFKKKGSLCFQ